MKYSSGSSSSNASFISRWRCKSTVKAVLICLFAFSTVFITYQLIYYMNLTEYQLEETHNRQEAQQGRLSLKERTSTPSSRGGGGGDKAYDFQDHLVVNDVRGDKDNKGVGGNRYKVNFDRKPGKPLLTSRILGVNPTDLHLYTNRIGDRSSFKCFSTSKRVSWDKVNDDFCDCPLDGSDEPSTAACVTGQFFCVRKDRTRGHIPSSRVNDGICDCSDGTDEHLGYVKCKKLN